MTNSYQDMAQRSINAQDTMIASLMECGDIALAEAEQVFAFYRKEKLFNTTAVYRMGRYEVKHGALLEKDVIRRALALAQSDSRP